MLRARESRRTGGETTHRGQRQAQVDRRSEIAERTKVTRVPAQCPRCGAVYSGKSWRASRVRARRALGASLSLCPACAQVAGGEYFGRVRILGALSTEREREIRSRIRNVEQRARFTQPERRTVLIERTPAGLEVTTTSEKLAHRIARELEKAFGGRAHYVWTDGAGQLEATWEPEAVTSPRHSRRGAKRG